MRAFVKLFWGPADKDWPIVAFSLRGSLTSLLERSRPGDVIAFAGTKGGETPAGWRGKIMGFAEFSHVIRPSRELLPPASYEASEKGGAGDMKWPWAVAATRSWLFDEAGAPDTEAVYGGGLPMAAIRHAVALSDDQLSFLLGHPHHEIDTVTSLALWDERAAVGRIVGPGGTMGPIPSSFTTEMVRDALQAASTYVVRFGTRDLWKVGWAHDHAARLVELNKHIPFEVLDEQWVPWRSWPWGSAGLAMTMERRVLTSFPDHLRYGERVHCTEEEIAASCAAAIKGA